MVTNCLKDSNILSYIKTLLVRYICKCRWDQIPSMETYQGYHGQVLGLLVCLSNLEYEKATEWWLQRHHGISLPHLQWDGEGERKTGSGWSFTYPHYTVHLDGFPSLSPWRSYYHSSLSQRDTWQSSGVSALHSWFSPQAPQVSSFSMWKLYKLQEVLEALFTDTTDFIQEMDTN